MVSFSTPVAILTTSRGGEIAHVNDSIPRESVEVVISVDSNKPVCDSSLPKPPVAGAWGSFFFSWVKKGGKDGVSFRFVFQTYDFIL